MKKLLVVLSIGFTTLLALSCGGNSTEDAAKEEKKDQAEAAAGDKPKSADYEKGLDLIAKSDCLTCHKVNEKLVGPAYQEVANKYQATDAVIDTLANKIITGGSGNWGQVPMTAHPQLALEDAKTMVKYVFTLKTN